MEHASLGHGRAAAGHAGAARIKAQGHEDGPTARQPDFERAKRYALERLERELPHLLRYHALTHTRDEVVPAAERLAALEGVTGEALVLLRTAAYYHDVGYIVQRQDHEAIGAQIAAQVLPQFGYTPSQVAQIRAMILATKLPQPPHTLLEAILADADLDNIGHETFWARRQDLRTELAALGMPMTDEQW